MKQDLRASWLNHVPTAGICVRWVNFTRCAPVLHTEQKGNVKDSRVGKFRKDPQNDVFPKYSYGQFVTYTLYICTI